MPVSTRPGAAGPSRLSAIERIGPTKRLVAGVGLVVAGIAIVLVVLLSGGGDGRAATPLGGPVAAAPPPPALSHHRVVDRSLGASLRPVAGWRVIRRRPALALRSRDRSVVLTIAAPARAARWRGVLHSAVGALRARTSRSKVAPGQGAALAGRRARSTVVTGRHARVLVIAARGRRRAYLVEVSTERSAPTRRLVEAQTMLGSLRLTH